MTLAEDLGADPRRFLVLKVGGALFSDKSKTNSLSNEVLDWYADLIARDYGEYAGRFILVTGGGSFGHGAVREAEGSSERMLALTDAVFALKNCWAESLRKRNVPVIPLQIASFAQLDSRGRLVLSGNPIQAALSRGILPILSGDIVFRESQMAEVFGSDRVPSLCLELGCRPLRVVMLTDRPGIIQGGIDGTKEIRDIDPLDADHALSAIWKEQESDVTAGMQGKLTSLIALATRGVECIIAEGRPTHASFTSIAELVRSRRYNFAHTRISPVEAAR